MLTNKSLHFSSTFAISCGTVLVDIQKSLVLVILYRKTGECLLAKGRKDIAERLEQTAVRETFKETGFPIALLPLPIPTLAITPTRADTADAASSAGRELVTEPVVVTLRVTDRMLKIIFWYAARVDSTAQRQEGTQQAGENFEPVRVPADKVAGTLSFDDDRQVAAMVVSAIQQAS